MKKKAKDHRLDKLYIPASTIERMNDLNHKTHNTGKEHGMSLCLSPDKRVVPGIESVGDESSIDIAETCGTRKNKYIGSFHTHPRPSETKFSAMDLFSSCDIKSKIDCVGMNRDGEIECYAKKQNKSCQNTAEALVKIEDVYLDIDEDDRKILKSNLLEEVDKITDQKFNSKKIL